MYNLFTALEGSPYSPATAFYAQLSHTIGDIGIGLSVIFDRVITNEGSGYNPTTGVFTCRVLGVYVFFLNVMTHNGKYVEVELVRNGQRFLIILAKDTGEHDNGSNLGVIRLGVGDTVWARVHAHDKSDNGDIIYPTWTTFSGFLLNSV